MTSRTHNGSVDRREVVPGMPFAFQSLPFRTLELRQAEKKLDDIRDKLARPISDVAELQSALIESLKVMQHMIRVLERVEKSHDR